MGGEAKDENCSLLIECRLDGPSTEDDIVRRTAAGLHLTPWSKELAAEWIRQNGRRFCIYKQRGDAGQPRSLKAGTMKNVIRRQHAAVDALAAENNRRRETPASSRGEGAVELTGPLLPRVDRHHFCRELRRKVAKCNNQQTADFLTETRNTNKKKRSVAVWAGEESGPVKLRRLGDRPTTQASALPRGSSHSSREIPGEDLLRVVENSGEDYLLLPTRQLQSARGFQVGSLKDLATGKASSSKLLPWMHAIAYGLPLKETKPPYSRCSHIRSSEQVRAIIYCTSEFRRKSPRLMNALDAICRKRDSLWKVVAAQVRGGSVIKTENDVRKFLLAVRRLEGTTLADKYPRIREDPG